MSDLKKKTSKEDLSRNRLREFEADYTPSPIVHQGLDMLADMLGDDPQLLLDPSAGAGVFGQQARVLWPAVETVGIEPRGEESRNLAKNYDRHEITTFGAWMKGGRPKINGCIIATNPPFTLFPQFVAHGHDLIERSGALILLGLSTWGQSAEGNRLFSDFRPSLQFRIGGRIGFRGPGDNPKTGRLWGTDQRDYSWWVWLPGRKVPRFCGKPYWRTFPLPVLPVKDRAWRQKPGTA